MGFWIFMSIFCLLTPLVMLLFGRAFARSAPKEINPLFGYRTELSMKNEDTWAFAHAHCGRLWKRVGFWLLPPSLLVMSAVFGKNENTVGAAGAAVVLMQCTVLIFSVFPTERALRKAFNADGSRKTAQEP